MRNQIENTKAWKALSKLQQSIYGKRKNMLEIEGQYIVAKNTSRKQWLEDYQPPMVYKNIINELLDELEPKIPIDHEFLKAVDEGVKQIEAERIKKRNEL